MIVAVSSQPMTEQGGGPRVWPCLPHVTVFAGESCIGLTETWFCIEFLPLPAQFSFLPPPFNFHKHFSLHPPPDSPQLKMV